MTVEAAATSEQLAPLARSRGRSWIARRLVAGQGVLVLGLIMPLLMVGRVNCPDRE